MTNGDHILALDQGTTSSRALLFGAGSAPAALAQRELPQSYPQPAWVEQDPETIWRDSLAVVQDILAVADAEGRAVAAIGIANQRETTLLWDRQTGRAIHPAIVWQDRRGEDMCRRLREEGAESLVAGRTGLLLDSYFSATKLAWLLDNVPGARALAEAGRLAFGTVDSFLLWRLTGGRVHATDATNASRTMLFDIHRQIWCPDLCRMFGVPMAILPEVRDSAADFGESDGSVLGRSIAITGVAGDQQAALIGQRCLAPGAAKATYGTGCFAMVNTGETVASSEHRLLATVGYRLGGRVHYALEGAIFVAGAGVKWLRDGLGLIASAGESERLAAGLDDNGGVYLVPAFAGLGAPHWRPETRALLTGMTLGTGRAHVARAMLEAVTYQTHDLVVAMRQDARVALPSLRVDGGMAANDWFCRFLAGILGVEVHRPRSVETTALGAARLAALGAGLADGMQALDDDDRSDLTVFAPDMPASVRQQCLAGWRAALAQVLAT